MEDIARHAAPQPDEVRHTLTVRDVEVLLAQAGVQRSHRHVLRMCQTSMLDAVKFPGGPSGDQWHITPASVPKAIGDLKQINEQRARRGALRPPMTDLVVPEREPRTNTDLPSRGAPQPATSGAENIDDTSPAQPAIARHGPLEHDIYQHPYVKRLEAQVEKVEKKYDDQVRRTEEIQLKSQQQIIELQRMTAIGQSQTLADFMLRAKEYFLGTPSEPEKGELDGQPTG